MKILAIADEEAKFFYDFYQPGKLDEFDLILACGDLKREYLEFLVTMARCPLLYVHGNHDDCFDHNPPEGCECIDGRLYKYQGIRILGLGGSYRYHKEGNHMYTERQMRQRIRKLGLPILYNRGVDILLTHAPARGVNDEDAIAHRGFQCFLGLIKKHKPKYFIHGHIHRNYGPWIPQICQIEETTVVNAFQYCKIEYE